MKNFKLRLISLILSVFLFSGCSIPAENVDIVLDRLNDYIFSLTHPFDEYLENYKNCLPSEDNQFVRPEGIAFNRLPYESRFGYSALSEDEQKLYRLIEDAVYNLEIIVDMRSAEVITGKLYKVICHFLSDCPDVFYLSECFTYSMYDEDGFPDLLFLMYTDGETLDSISDDWSLEHEADRSAIADHMSELYNKVTRIMANMPNGSELSNTRYIHDYIASHAVYDYDHAEKIIAINNNISEITYEELCTTEGNSSTAYGALCLEKAVCSGLCDAAGLLMNEAGIVNGVCAGDVNEQPHIWNIVKIGEKYYHMDVTGDMSWNDKDSFTIVYDYFLATDAKMKETITFTYPQRLYTAPACSDESLYLNDDITLSMSTSGGFTVAGFKKIVTKAYKNSMHIVVLHSDSPFSTYSIDNIYWIIKNRRVMESLSDELGRSISLDEYYNHSTDFKTVWLKIIYR